jgi:carbonic anhydrase
LPAPSANVAGLLSAVRSNLGWSVGSASLDAWEEGVKVNVRQTRDSLLGSSPVLRQRALEGRVLVAGAIYRLETGQVELLVE